MQSRATREQWRKRVRAWRASGLSRDEFAQRAGCHAGTLSWWRWKLAAEGSSAAARRRERRQVPSPLAFVEVTPESGNASASSGEERIEIAVGRLTLRVPAGFEAQTLGRVLDVLEARR